MLKRPLLNELLVNKDYEKILEYARTNHKKTLNLIQRELYYDMDDPMRWYAIEALGYLAKHLTDEDPNIYIHMLQRFLWTMNDEGGNVPWSATECMASIIANQPKRFADYTPKLITNGLDNPMCFRGTLWACGKISQINPDLVLPFVEELAPFLSDPDPNLCGYAAWAFGFLKDQAATGHLKDLLSNNSKIKIFIDGELYEKTVGELAQEALIKIDSANVS